MARYSCRVNADGMSKRKIATDLLTIRGIDPTLEEQVWGKPFYELSIRRLLNGWSIEDVLKGEKSYEIHDGINKCIECGSRKVLDRSMQTRSADEGETYFFYCTICKTSWKT